VTDLLVISGFADQAAVDGFVRSEIRYFRSRDMRAYRCEAPESGHARPALAFAFGDRPDLAGIAAALSRSHPDLLVTWSRETLGRVLSRSYRAGAAGPETAAEGPLPGPAESYRELEEIYGTF